MAPEKEAASERQGSVTGESAGYVTRLAATRRGALSLVAPNRLSYRNRVAIGQTQVDGIFLDFFGTVAAGDREAVETLCGRLVRELELDLMPAELAVRWGEQFFAVIEASNAHRFQTLHACECQSLDATLRALDRQVDPTGYIADLRAYWRAPPLYPEVHDVLDALPRPVCIVSNIDRADLAAALETHGIRVANTVTSEQARAYKPHAAIFELALERTGWSADRVLHVGDSLHSDVDGARRSGIRSVWINRGSRIHDIGTARPDHTLSDLRGLVNFFTE